MKKEGEITIFFSIPNITSAIPIRSILKQCNSLVYKLMSTCDVDGECQ